MNIHPSAIIHPKAQLGKNITIGPYCIIAEHVTIGDDTVLDNHVVIENYTKIGRNCRLHSCSVIGGTPQDLKFKGGETYVEIGDNNIIREFVTINRATEPGSITKIGNNNLIMAYVHIAHNCTIGNNVILANVATLAGHVCIEDYAVVGGGVFIHQFVQIGKYSITGGCSKVVKDTPPYLKVAGDPSRPYGLNTVGLQRHNFPKEVIHTLKTAYKILYRQGLTLQDALSRIEQELGDSQEIVHFVKFIRASKRGICR
ncbi:MAG: acyl-ACP--UDP-N-acetylglucosamine O-acyltransferase [bacterium]|nr:acyl-ACP--UDP-N-acetylglucosamine O-acyltransferase [bacterium]